MAAPQTIHANSLVQRAKAIPFSQLDDELLAIDPHAGYCYSLNESAGRIWELIEAPTPVSAACAILRQEYAVDESTCLSDVIALLQALAEAGLVHVRNGAAA